MRYIPHAVGGIIRVFVVPGAVLAGQALFSGISALYNTGWQEKPKEKKVGNAIACRDKGKKGPARDGLNDQNIESPESNNHEFNKDLISNFYEGYCEDISHENSET